MSATELGPWAVVVPGGETGYAYGRFVEREIADRFAAFVAAKFDTTAVVVPDTEVSADAVRLDAARELLNWWDTQPAATVAPAVNGCGWCGYAQTGHGIRYSAIPGLHAWTAPTDRQRLNRMSARRAARTTPTTPKGPAIAPARPRLP
ncbi:hypothetical protein EDD29_0144 [Actinocorallia herbida]|uniref:Uncharacterized protein n=1 Tax=Actinocorallia herbida TaxID=58109 RepID=A0A3N1CN06_9ACTN|nr:hypothetical protein [Actinocorallia herbida]ROO82663.1 hypothetical protein EDD29_0144 [Actinocorallia herbida]